MTTTAKPDPYGDDYRTVTATVLYRLRIPQAWPLHQVDVGARLQAPPLHRMYWPDGAALEQDRPSLERLPKPEFMTFQWDIQEGDVWLAGVTARTSQGTQAQRAQRVATKAHAGQKDKRGRDYVTAHLGPVAVLLRPYGDLAEAAGWLHDILEDTETTAEMLRTGGFPLVVVEAVEAVTKRKGEKYADLIERAAAHPLGRLVKLADNWVNAMGLGDLPDPEVASRLRAKYEPARERLLRALVTGR